MSTIGIFARAAERELAARHAAQQPSSTPLTLSLSDSDETRGRLWTWFVRMGIGWPRKHSFPGWIPRQQRACCRAEAFLAARLGEQGFRIIDANTAPLRRNGSNIEFRRGLLPWERLCTVADLVEHARA